MQKTSAKTEAKVDSFSTQFIALDSGKVNLADFKTEHRSTLDHIDNLNYNQDQLSNGLK